ncbi:hypothetical protein LXA43DRAFT_971513 [Ganoderma leucocontextum]|nr:hypothetical protein LXA43DRAFT_971513 [Ganoderma leucocontextum]
MASTTARTRDDARGRYSHTNPDPFSDEFYHAWRRTGRLAALTALPTGIYKMSVTRFGRRRGPTLLCFCCLAFLLSMYALHQRFVSGYKAWPVPWRGSKSVVFGRDELRKIWDWEVRSGHYPSTRPIPVEMGFMTPPKNPALPASVKLRPPAFKAGNIVQFTTGSGAERIYPDVRNRPPDFGRPPRPIPGSVADLDRILEQCDFSAGKYVRDCHEFLRLGAGLDDAGRLRREDVESLRYVYVIDGEGGHISARSQVTSTDSSSTNIKRATDDGGRDLQLPPHSQYNPNRQGSPCSEDDPRIFHMFWSGPFTDKPYMAMIAFLFTQNTGLHLESPTSDSTFCRPQLWLWVSRGPLDAMPDPHAQDNIIEELRKNAWSAPFLHPRFKDVIQFKLWNTTEQLDNTPELKDDWRRLGGRFLFSEGATSNEPPGKKVGSDVSLDGKTKETFQTYNKMPVILSDLVRFVLCHRYGGVYLDVDMLFLRDWEELWGWNGSFSYRWSHEDRYNTAVLRLRKGSALGTFLLRTALFNNMDFHPTTVSRYLKDAHMEKLLYRIPDALFDPAWLNTDNRKLYPWKKVYFQRDRPAQPFFTDFDQFFNTPPEMGATPAAIGFDGFFRGAFLYHYHNEWWKPFDRSRFWPDLGPRFADAERIGRAAIANKSASYVEGLVKHDKQDLDWATVLKRTFEAYIRGERPNMYGEWIQW